MLLFSRQTQNVVRALSQNPKGRPRLPGQGLTTGRVVCESANGLWYVRPRSELVGEKPW